MKTKKLLLLLLGFLLSGCSDLFDIKIPVSLHPLYTEKELVFEERLLGTWFDGDTKLMFKEGEDVDSYDLIFSDGEEKAKLAAHLVKIDEMLFLDLASDISYADCNDFSAILLLPTHMFMKIEAVEPKLRIRFVNMMEAIENDPKLIKHEIVEANDLKYIVLTASTKELQAFVLKYADDSRVFTDEIVLNRKKTKEPNEPNDTDPNAAEPNDD